MKENKNKLTLAVYFIKLATRFFICKFAHQKLVCEASIFSFLYSFQDLPFRMIIIFRLQKYNITKKQLA